MADINQHSPLVSVIIPCYNHGQYLQEAIDSIKNQDYPSIEIIVVDDGSIDNTEKVAKQNEDVKYVYQSNQGLSAARNTGIENSRGEYLIFLDADDWLYPQAIWKNISYLLEDNKLAFVSGGHYKVYIDEGKTLEENWEVNSDHYIYLLQRNYIGMHATVMYSRWIFDEYNYDTTLKACEDYDLYLKIVRKYPVVHHNEKIAAYRLHSFNMSGNIPLMLGTVLKVLDRQYKHLNTAAEKQAYSNGKAIWKGYYCNELFKKLLFHPKFASKDALSTLLKHSPQLGILYLYKRNYYMITSILKKIVPVVGLRQLHKLGLYKHFIPSIGKVHFGDFRSVTPFSKQFGFDRGGAIDRYYVENFLEKEADSIKGRVLEIGDNSYTLQYGKDRISKSDILHVDDSNKSATIVGDISNAPHIPDNSFDCLILTQTLHLIYDFKEALNTCYRILKPGGTLLLTVPGITPIDHFEWKETWYWSFTDKAMKKVMNETFKNGKSEVNNYGNVHVATAFLYGLGLQEISKVKLDEHDPHFQVIITVKAVKH